MQQHFEVEGAGHYGIFAGRRWREAVYPIVKAFILRYQTAPAPTAPEQPTVAAEVLPADAVPTSAAVTPAPTEGTLTSSAEMSGTPTVPVAIDDKPAAPTVKRVRRKVTKHQA